MISLLIAAGFVFTPIIVPGQAIVNAFGPNDRDELVVNTDTSSGVYRHGRFTPLPPLPAGYLLAGALGVNNDGVVVGGANASTTSPEQGFILVGSKYTFFARPPRRAPSAMRGSSPGTTTATTSSSSRAFSTTHRLACSPT